MSCELQIQPTKGEIHNRADYKDSRPLLQPPGLHKSVEIGDEEQEKGSAACCRICLESEPSFSDELIAPCMCKGTQQFVHRECLDHWRSVKEGFAFSHCTTCKAQFHLRLQIPTIAALGGVAYVMDVNGQFRNSFTDDWDRVPSKYPVPFYYCLGVFMFFVILGISGLVVHCSSASNNDPCMAGCRHCCYGWGILDCFPASMEACGALLVIFIVIFAILGIAYGLLAATMAIQRIWQRHYHILTKRELTKEYVVEDLHGNYTPPKLDAEHEGHLRTLKLL
eukprot:c27405_g1_i1 orf=324-1163(+)